MPTSSIRNTRDVVFDRAPPIITDLCSVRAAGADPAGPILTSYRKQPSPAADWIAGAARDKRFDVYLLRPGGGRWELCDVDGQPEETDRRILST